MAKSYEAALARAAAKAAEGDTIVTRVYMGETWEFRFNSRATEEGLAIVAQLGSQEELQSKLGDDGNIDAQTLDELMKAVTALLDAQAIGETAEMVADLIRARVIGIRELLDIQREMIEAMAARPSTPSGSSQQASEAATAPSTATALPAPSTPPASLSTGS